MKTCKRIILFALLCGLMLWTAAAYAASHQYGKVNTNSVRFRKEAEKTDYWAMLDKNWPVEILDTKTVSGVKYYRVSAGIPNHTDRTYYGYIQQKYVTKTSSKPATPTTSSSSSDKTSTKTASGSVQTTTDKVNLRKSASTDSESRGQVKKGTTLSYSAIVTVGDVKWYKVKYNGNTCYIMAKYCKTVSAKEAAKETCKDASIPSDPSTTALTTKAKVILRSGASGDAKQLAVLTNKNALCTLTGTTKKAEGYVWYKVKADGKTGYIRGDLLRILSKAEAKTYTDKSSSKGTLYSPELTEWSGIKSIFYKGCVATVTDVKTGISFKVKRWSGGSHADVEPLTAADTAAMCRIYGVSTAQEIADKDLYQRRAILVTVGGHSYAASMYGEPHNDEGNTIKDNNFQGQFCIHFTNSKTHGSDKVDADHQKAVTYAYTNGVSQLTQYGYAFQ